jgi:mRNA interferase RelE/StbE
MQLRAPTDIAHLIRGMHPQLKKKVRASLKMVLDDPEAGKALRFELAGLRSLRIGSFRLIYRLGRSHIEIVALGPRERIYEETWRLVRKDTGRAD